MVVGGVGVPVYTHGKTSGVVHKEHDLPVTHILGSKGEDHDEYIQKLENINVMTPLSFGNLGVETPWYTRDTDPHPN